MRKGTSKAVILFLPLCPLLRNAANASVPRNSTSSPSGVAGEMIASYPVIYLFTRCFFFFPQRFLA